MITEVRLRTYSGSLYSIDLVHRKWVRIRGKNAAPIRSNWGDFYSFSIDRDLCINLICPPFESEENPVPRLIRSTPVVEVLRTVYDYEN